MSLKEKILTIVFVVIVLLSGWLRFEQTKKGNFPFTYDQARDMLDIRTLGEFKDIMVMGPTTSINGLRLGPFYYYLMLPAYWIGDGNPQALVNWNIFLFLISGISIFLFFRKRDITTGFLISTIFLLAPRLFDTTRYFWNANSAVYLSVFFFLSLYFFIENKDKKSVFWLGLTAAILTQFEAAFGIICLCFSVLIVVLNNKIKYWKAFLTGVIPWFLPQLLLEIKNKFQMTKLFLGIFNNSNQVLENKLSFLTSVSSHFKSIVNVFEGQFSLPYYGGLILIILAFIASIFFKKYKKVNKYFFSLLFFSFIFYIIFYHYPLKEWYIDILRVWMTFVIGFFLSNLLKINKVIWLIVFLFLLRSFILTVSDQQKYRKYVLSDDPKNLNNLEKNIEWIYKKMDGKGFRAYNYVPEIYDYSQQYLFWWKAKNTYNYLPDRISYSLDLVPEYVANKDNFNEINERDDENMIALTYEIRFRYYEWLGQFKNYCVKDEWQTEWKTKLEIREKCPSGKVAP